MSILQSRKQRLNRSPIFDPAQRSGGRCGYPDVIVLQMPDQRFNRFLIAEHPESANRSLTNLDKRTLQCVDKRFQRRWILKQVKTNDSVYLRLAITALDN